MRWARAVTGDLPIVVISEGPWGEYRLLEVPFCEYAMRGGPGPHPTLLRSPSNKHISLSTLNVKEKKGIFEAAA